jgi:hypothetical protein
MIDWLRNYSGKTGGNNDINNENAELQFLRKELAKHGKAYDPSKDSQVNKGQETGDSEGENEDEVDIEAFEEELKIRKAKNLQKGQRSSISEESYGQFNIKKEYVPRVINKSDEQKERISETLEKSILFSTLLPKEKDTVLLAMEEKRYKMDDIVIKQGDQGDVLFLIEQGYYECFKQFVSCFIYY